MPSSLSKQPLYSQVATLIAQRIAEGDWKPGAALPNEQDLAREMGVSSGTMRKALDWLEECRLLVRRQGRGTFVADHAAEEFAARFINLRTADGRHIAGTGRVLDQCRAPAGVLEQSRLLIEPGQTVLRTKRLCTCDGRPFMYEDAALAVTRMPGLRERELLGDYQLTALAQRHGVLLGRASERVALFAASGDLAELLEVAPGTALLHLDRVVYSLGGEPVEWRVAFCHLKGEYYLVDMC